MSASRAAKGGGRPPIAYLVAGALTGAIVLWLAYLFVLTIPVTIDGRQQRMMAGTLVSDLFDRKLVHGLAGDLVAAKDKRVLRRGKGEAAYVTVNGKRAALDARLARGDVIESKDGKDVVEPLVKRTEEIPAPLRYEGTGSLETVVSSGKSGLREITSGQLSKQVVATRVVREPVARVVERRSPGGKGRVVALTFDDGPWPGQTEAILGILKKYKIKATFFEIGVQAKGRPYLSKMLADAGMLLGNHTQSHNNLKKLSAEAVSRQIRTGQDSITRASGQKPKYFRPPGGNVAPAMWPVLSDLGLKSVLWDVDTGDWRKPGVAAIVDKVVKNVHPGSVVLMHDGGGDRSQTVKALPTIIEKLKAMGYEFVTLDGIDGLPTRMG